MGSLVLKGDTSGQVTLAVPAVAGTRTITLPAATGTMALTSDITGIGYGQVWSSPARSAGVTYTNTTGKPIMVRKNPSGTSAAWTIGGVSLAGGQTGSTGYNWVDTAIVPVGATYSANFGSWQELS